jgi:hypothetical protein
MITSASENGRPSPSGTWRGEARTGTIAGAIKGLFKAAAKMLACPDDEPKPSRKSGDTEKGFGMAAKAIMRRVAETESYAAARGYLSDTLDWLNLWQDNAAHDHWLDDDFSAKQDRNFPHP